MVTHYKVPFVSAVLAISCFVGIPAHAACVPGEIGASAQCPEYTAPAVTAVPGPSVDGTAIILPAEVTPLFGGAVPPNGFMVEIYDANTFCYLSDSITHHPGDNINGKIAGFHIFGPNNATGVAQELIYGHSYTTPIGYKPIGAVNIWCPVQTTTLINARAW